MDIEVKHRQKAVLAGNGTIIPLREDDVGSDAIHAFSAFGRYYA
jgi:hypothetical protein